MKHASRRPLAWLIFDVRQKMKHIATIALFAFLAAGCGNSPKLVSFVPGKIEATLSERKIWVREQKDRDRQRFRSDYEWLLSAKAIGAKEAKQIAYLFFYSTDTRGGYFEEPRLAEGIWRLDFVPEMRPSSASPVFVDSKTGEVWQEGQAVKVDALKLIRYE